MLLGTALSAVRRRFQDTMKGMGESLYQSMDAPMAPLEKKVEAWRPAETCCFKLDLCAPLPSSCSASSLACSHRLAP